MSAIVYTTNTGTTEQYAKLLSEKLSIPCYALKDCPLAKGEEIIYLGWVMASHIKGCKKALRQYNIKALCGVCMGETGSQLKELRGANGVSDNLPLFSLQGGYNKDNLHGIYKFMMSVMEKTLMKGLTDKKERTSDEEMMLNMVKNGANYVSADHLKSFLDWYDIERK